MSNRLDSPIEASSVDSANRKKTEEDLREIQESFQGFVDQSLEGVALTDEEGRFIEWSRSMEVITGYRREEVVGKFVWEVQDMLTPKDSRSTAKFEVIMGAVREALKTGKGAFLREVRDAKFIRANGEIAWIRQSAFPIKTAKGWRIGTLVQDVTNVREREEALKNNEARYRSIFENSFDAIMLTRPDGSILSANPAACRMFDMTEEEIVRGGRDAIIVNDNRLEVALRERIEKGRVRAELTYRRKDGSTFPGEVVSSLFTDSDGVVKTSMILRDITERKQAEEALKESEQKYRYLFEHSVQNIGIYEMVRDESGEIVDWMLLDANQPLEQQSGMPLESMRGKRITELWGWDDSKDAIERSREIISSGEGQQFESRWGERRYLASYFPLGENTLAAVGVDITERKRAEEELKGSNEELRKSERLYRSIGELIPYGIWITDLDGGVVYVSQNFLDMLGMTMDEVRKFGWTSRLPPEDKERTIKDWRRFVAEDRPLWDFEYYIMDRNGDYKSMLSIGVPVRDGNGKTFVYAGMNLDNTERKKNEEALRRSNAELQQFACVASHDLKEPLRMIESYLGLLEKRYDGKVLDEKAMEYMRFVMEGADRMEALVNDLLSYSRVETRGESFAPVNMDGVVRGVRKDLKVAIEEAKADVIVDPLPTVMADKNQMIQLMQNLLSNAVKFHGAKRPIIHVSAHKFGRFWRFAVQDNGIGIDPACHERIFDMFQRLHTKEEYEGTGIGLAVAKKIVERHGGRIWVESEEEKGATFYFTIR